MGCFMYFILGSTKDINIGPTAIMALMIQPHVSKMGPAGAILITFLSGFIVDFFSYPIIAGFTTAAALNIASSQIKSIFGIAGKSDSFLAAWIALFEHIREARFNIIINDDFLIFKGNVDGGLPDFTLPPFSTTYNGTYYSFTDMMENYAKGKTLNATQELLALGFSNIMSSFVQSMPVTGSFTRTAINNASGARTPACGVITGVMVLLALGFLTKMDLIPLTTTLVFCLLINLEYGILIGIATNITFVLYASARPKVELEEQPPNIYVVKLKTGLYYTAAEHFREFVLQNCLKEKSVVVSLNTLYDELKLRDQKLVFWNFKDSVKDTCIGVNTTLSSILLDGELQEVLQKTE
nr:unnamed protein product [Callosobruchus chinensis]